MLLGSALRAAPAPGHHPASRQSSSSSWVRAVPVSEAMLWLLLAAPLTAAAQLRGSLDGIDGALPHCAPRCEASSPGPVVVSGWAVDPTLAGGGRPPVNVSIVVDGTVVATGLADKPRPDLVPAHVAPDPNHGFSIPLPPDVAKMVLSPSQRKVHLTALVNLQPLPDPNGCAQLSCTNKQAPSERFEFVQLGSLKVGVDMSRGGSIAYMSSDATKGVNIVNAADMGREIQLSFYSGPDPYNPPTEAYPNGACDKLFGGVPWPWNPIGAGDVDGNHGQILSFSKTATSWHLVTRPLQWACHNVSCDCTFEQVRAAASPSARDFPRKEPRLTTPVCVPLASAVGDSGWHRPQPDLYAAHRPL